MCNMVDEGDEDELTISLGNLYEQLPDGTILASTLWYNTETEEITKSSKGGEESLNWTVEQADEAIANGLKWKELGDKLS